MRLRLRAIFAAISLAAATALTACGGSDEPAAYVAIGDSYSSGVGAERYTKESGACLRSTQSYVYQLDRKPAAFRACAGATTGGVQDLQLKPFPANTDLVTITVGGNDAGFLAVIATCLLRKAPSCEKRIDAAERYARDELPGRLRRTFDAIRRRAPEATVVVPGYPRLVAQGPWCGSFGNVDAREQRRINAASDLLAKIVGAEVKKHEGFRFVDVRETFDGHEACSDDPWINASTNPGIYSFHPNVTGYSAYARAIKQAL